MGGTNRSQGQGNLCVSRERGARNKLVKDGISVKGRNRKLKERDKE